MQDIDAEPQPLMSDADQDALAAAVHALDAALFQANVRLGELAAGRQTKRQPRGTGRLVEKQGVKRQPGTGTLKLAAGQARPKPRPATAAMAQGATAPIAQPPRGPKRPARTGEGLETYAKPEAGAIDRLIAAVEAAEGSAKDTLIVKQAPGDANVKGD